ncbi:hypothetical protein BJ508DRAFT_101991 [Ascobolus immersus RN42]|uniref:Uncharacterized protein n=1 Tax=Ascobolus immersus RN42 TaxID=1160509 RepID=A0A3N4H996_ASCIM|nr:hypothetical protein BJ508DRAFT_101991 [Ascobolus immersus RN42]
MLVDGMDCDVFLGVILFYRLCVFFFLFLLYLQLPAGVFHLHTVIIIVISLVSFLYSHLPYSLPALDALR